MLIFMSNNLLTPSNLPILFHQFKAVKIRNPKCVWVHDIFHEVDAEMTETMRAFGETFGYLVKNGVTFDNLEFDEADTKLFLAERYGGFGIGYNGGGARCGSLGPFQVKGCGKNLLAGADQDVHHSYGGFKALYAAHEAIYGSILEGILPLGAVRILGIILTGADGAYVLKDVERGWGH